MGAGARDKEWLTRSLPRAGDRSMTPGSPPLEDSPGFAGPSRVGACPRVPPPPDSAVHWLGPYRAWGAQRRGLSSTQHFEPQRGTASPQLPEIGGPAPWLGNPVEPHIPPPAPGALSGRVSPQRKAQAGGPEGGRLAWATWRPRVPPARTPVGASRVCEAAVTWEGPRLGKSGSVLSLSYQARVHGSGFGGSVGAW